MTLNRKEFLKKTGIVLATPLIAGKMNPLLSQDKNSRKSLSSRIFANTAIVLGGGLAGLYSAHLLKKKGMKVRIVEGANRLGGRIYTFRDRSTGVTADLGGEYIGERQSIIRGLLREFDLQLKSPDWTEMESLWDDGRLSERSKKNLDKLMELQSKIPAKQIEGLDKISLYRYLKYQGFSVDELNDLDRVVKAFFGESSRNISSHHLLTAISSNKSYFQKLSKIEGGAESLIDKMKENFDPDEILLGNPAVKVSQSKSGVQLELASGIILRSKHLICTLPTQAVSGIQWNPGLPRDKIFALLRVGYGMIRKELVQVETPPTKPLQGEGIVDWVFPNSEKHITTVSSGGRAVSLNRSQSEIQRELILRSIFKWEPTTVTSLGVKREGFGEGAVSLYTPSTYGLKEILETSVENIHFAGEHLGEIPGTMEAALSSAFRAVTRI